ncbi:MAG: ABC transporter ATP-binding protein [Promethearchaeota archaeon]
MRSKHSDRELLSFLWQYVKLEKGNFNKVVLLLLINTGLAISAPLFFREGLAIIEKLNTTTNTSSNLRSLIITVFVYIILTIALWFTTAIQYVFMTRLNANVIKNIRIDTFKALLQNKVSFFDNHESGVLTSNITNDIQELYDTGDRFAYIVTSFLRLFAILCVLFYFSALLTLTSLIFLPIIFLIAVSLRKFQRRVEASWRKRFSEVNQKFSENMRSIAVSKAFNREEANLESFHELNEATYQASVKRGFAIFIFGPTSDFLRHLLLISMLFVGSWQVSRGDMPVATFYLFIFLLSYYYYPVIVLARNYNRFQALFANLSRILRITSDNPLEENYPDMLSANELLGAIKFSSVDFSYIPDTPVLQKVSFHVEPGQRVALVGHTGAGKSTIAMLIIRFYEIIKGEIALDQQPIQNYDLHSLRKNIAFVSQRVLLFKGTIRENLLIANPEASDEEIWAALDAVQARDFIESLPKGLDSRVDEGGRNLSAGQRQMISFARALLSKPKVIILDEATSAVDLYTESRIQDSTDLLLEGRTSIVIAHRLTTILKSDCIVVLEDGVVKQTGTHNELVSEVGPYQEMYQLYFETQSAKYLEKIKTTQESIEKVLAS